jgi:hypothetical protein
MDDAREIAMKSDIPNSFPEEYPSSILEGDSKREDGDFDVEWEQDRKIWLRELRELEKKIEKAGSSDLDRLSKAGMDRSAMIKLLALAANGNRGSLSYMRDRHAALKSLARRLRTMARDAKKVVEDPFCKIQTWAYLSGGGAIGMPKPTLWEDVVGVPLIASGMGVFANILDKEAKEFGRFLRRVSRIETGVVLLLTRCWLFQNLRTRKPQLRLTHLNEIARLLSDAFEAAGKTESFSADGLRQIFKRHGRRMIILWLEFATPAPPQEPIYIPPRPILASGGSLYGGLTASRPLSDDSPP